MSTLLNPIEAHERNIGQVFSDNYSFEIPPYQRPYAWEEAQVRELIGDLLHAMENAGAGGNIYFAGPDTRRGSERYPSARLYR